MNTVFLGRIWARVLQVGALVVLVRVPLLMALTGFVLSAYVAQIRELFDISLGKPLWAASAWLFSAGLSLLVWYSARTLYRFEWPHWQTSLPVQIWLGERLPRLLGAAVPTIMAGAYWQASQLSHEGSRALWITAYLALAVGFWLFATFRRPLVRRVAQARMPGKTVLSAHPEVGLLQHWHQLGWTRHLHYAGLIALPGSWLVGALFPSSIDAFGPLALILGAAAFSVWASTCLVYLAARARFPLLSALAVWAVLMTALGWNDNHRVRLTAEQHSNQNPATDLNYRPQGRPQLQEFVEQWSQQRQQLCGDKLWLISSEGGGIRAAMWTVLVLSELHRESDGRLWPCTVAVSGVSGGSLGLSVFASAYRDQQARLGDDELQAMVSMLESDFLAPVLGSMFGLDTVQRFLPLRVFSDRGEALEDAWIKAYTEYFDGASFRGPLADTAFALDAAGSPLPALLLNTTIVDSGLRLVQHPFASLGGELGAERFPGVVDGALWLPGELPVFSATHNSARFTFVSPAGSVLREQRQADGRTTRTTLGQLVDGGYFENSATTTLEALIPLLTIHAPEAALRVIHISNDPAVPAFAGGDLDECPDPTRLERALEGAPTMLSSAPDDDSLSRRDDLQQGDEPLTPRRDPPSLPSAKVLGEARAPLVAILATRNARGEYARQSLLDRVDSLGNARLWHYRLCEGQRLLPLGWTLGAQSTGEMQRQLNGEDRRSAAKLPEITAQIVEQLRER